MKDLFLIKTLIEDTNTTKIEFLHISHKYSVMTIFRKESNKIEDYSFLLEQKELDFLNLLKDINPVTGSIHRFIVGNNIETLSN